MLKKMPNSLSIIFVLIVIMSVLTWIITPGMFERQYDEELGRNLVIPGTYQPAEGNPQNFMEVMRVFFDGFTDAAEIIAFVLIVGGAYGIIIKTGAIGSGLHYLTSKLGNNAKLLIPILMFLFAIGGTTTGMWEELLPFYPIIIPLMIAFGYDKLVAVGVVLLGAATGTMASTVNPFATGIASAIAEVTLQDGMVFRLIAWVVCVSITVIYVLLYANKVKRDPTKSLVYADMEKDRDHFLKEKEENPNNQLHIFPMAHKLILALFLSMILFMIYAISQFGWWMGEITVLFLSVAAISGILVKMTEKEFWDSFVDGSSDFLFAALVIGMARGITIIADQGQIMDTILFSASELMSNLSQGVFIVVNQIVQMFIAFLVPSSSGHAALTISVMAPLADLFYVPRSSIVTAYQFASGMINMITPTAGVLMAALNIGHINWGVWLRFVLPLLAIQFIATISILLLSVYMA